MNTRIAFRFLLIFPFYITILFVTNYYAFPHYGIGFFHYLLNEARHTLPVILYFFFFSLFGFALYHATRYRFSKPKPVYDNIESKTDPFGVEIKLFHAPMEMPVEYSLWNRKLPVDFEALAATLQKSKLDIPFDPASIANETAITPMEQGIFATLQAYPHFPADLSGYHDQSLLQHTFHVWAYARHKYPPDKSEILAGDLTKHQFIHILAAAHDLGKLMSYRPSSKGEFTLVSTRHAMLSAVVLRQIPEYATLDPEARRIINSTLPLIDKNEHAKPISVNPSILLIARSCLHADAYVTQREIDLRATQSAKSPQPSKQPAPPAPNPAIVATTTTEESTTEIAPSASETSAPSSPPPTSTQFNAESPHPVPVPIPRKSTAADPVISEPTLTTLSVPIPSAPAVVTDPVLPAPGSTVQDIYSLGDTLSDCLPEILPKLNINRTISASRPIDGIYKPELGCVLIAQSSLIRQLAALLPPEITNRYHLDLDQHASVHPASYDIANALREASWITFTVNNITTDSGIFLVRSGKSPKSTPFFAFFTTRISEDLLKNLQPWEFEISIKPQLRTKN